MSDITYYDITISNPKNNNNPKLANFFVNFTKPLINKANDYKLLVQKFNIDTSYLPAAICEIKNPQSLKTENWETIYNVYMRYNNIVYSKNVIFNTRNKPNHPPIPLKKENDLYYYDNKDPYFFIGDASYFIRKINQALEECLNVIPNKPTSNPPFFIFDSNSQLLSLYSESQYYNTFNQNHIEVFFNVSLVNFVCEGFAGYFQYPGSIQNINETVFQITIQNKKINIQTINNIDYIVVTQDFSATSSFSQVNSIVLISDTLPVKKEYFPMNNNNCLLFSDKQDFTMYDNLLSLPIICIFHPISNKLGDMQTKIIYSNQNINNSDLISLTNNEEINKLHIKICFTDCYNNIYPLYLLPGKQLSIRLAFIKN